MLYLSEHFYSIQGEGKLSGTPSIFLRFGGCNLQCVGFATKYSADGEERVGCDSFYAVDRAFQSEWLEIHNIEDIQNLLLGYPDIVKDIVLTGGEPLIYAKNKIFIELLRYLKAREYRITIETNGTIAVSDIDEFKDITYSISTKLSNSYEEFNKRFNLVSLHSLVGSSKELFFKFTLDKASIKSGVASEIERISRFFPDIPIYCMPVGYTAKELSDNSESVINLCLEHGYNYSDRLHVRVWNDKRGY
jgi:organic radical activating enzyme